ncbi:antichymotrypsin-2-like isoform X2 [Choristoneura fumiferana]|uniref:antichymotrypsin-2-like isoform X2 n=1 Tax=Choristoneura fumiferana TaxID=7141 RepID=UPI003D159F1F
MERQVSYSVANFAAKFCNELGTDKTSICSPLSAEIMLALLALGCKNQSHDELLKALDMTDDDAIRSSYGFLTSTLKSVQDAALNVANKERKPDDKYANNIFQFSLDQLDFIGNESAAANINNWVLNVANKVYLKKGGELKPDIEKDARNVFQSSLDQLDFIEKEAAAATINNWVAQQTNNKIKDIVSPDMMSEDTRVVLVNAIYFQGLWVKPFYASATKNRSFRVNERTTIQVPMMSLTETYFDYGVSKELKAKLLRMKYQGGQASMVIVLPDEVEGLKSVLQKLASGHNIMTDIESMRSTDLDIVIPKFKVETTIDLKKLLPNLGIKSIFDAKNADIDMLKSNEKLFVSDAIQKALIIVDENGTKAAACTVSFGREICYLPRQRFIANHSFLFLLIAHQIPLFIGVYKGSEFAA